MGEARTFIPALESVRGIAALIVLISHACVGLGGRNWALLERTVWQTDTADELLRRVILAIFNGSAAVSMFFVLSGFVLALSLRRDDRTPPAKAAAFAGRRLLRIYPALVVSLVLSVAIFMALSALSFPVGVPTAAQLGANLLLIDFQVNGATWALLVELLAVPLLLVCHFLALRFGMRGVLVVVLLCVLGLFFGRGVMWHVLPHSDATVWSVVFAYFVEYQFMFALGLLIAEWCRSGPAIGSTAATATIAIATVLLLGARAVLGFSAPPALLIEGLSAGAIIAALAASRRFAAHSFLEWRPIRHLGMMSYSFYLYHWVALVIVTLLLARALSDQWMQAHPYVAAIMITVAGTVLTVPLAWASYLQVEKPGIRLGRRLSSA